MIALIGDYNPDVPAHRAIPLALTMANSTLATSIRWQWFQTAALTDPHGQFASISGIWVVPGSPYENQAGALHAIRFARETNLPLLGTCGGFQHLLIEYARNVLGLNNADSSEIQPKGNELVVTQLQCSLVDKSAGLKFAENSRIAQAYSTASASEGYRCNFGLNSSYRQSFESAGLRFTAFDEDGEIRAAELPGHRFYVGTLFQPERAALTGTLPPLTLAFLKAITAGP